VLGADSRTKFKIISTSRNSITLSLKAETPQERDSWVESITSMINKEKNGEIFLEFNDTSLTGANNTNYDEMASSSPK